MMVLLVGLALNGRRPWRVIVAVLARRTRSLTILLWTPRLILRCLKRVLMVN